MLIKYFVVLTYIIVYILLIKKRIGISTTTIQCFLQGGCKNPIVCDMNIFPEVYFILREQWSKKYLFYLSLESFIPNICSIRAHAVRKRCLRMCGMKWKLGSVLSSTTTWCVGFESVYWFLYLCFHSGVDFSHFKNGFQSSQCFYKALLPELALTTLPIICVSEL